MINRLAVYLILTLSPLAVAQNSKPNVDNIKLPVVVMEKESQIPTETEARRKKIGEAVNKYFDRYNADFKKLNKVDWDPITSGTRISWKITVESFTAEQLKQDPEAVITLLKADCDTIAKKMFVAAALAPEPSPPTATIAPPPARAGPITGNSYENIELRTQLAALARKYEDLEKQNKEIIEAVKQSNESAAAFQKASEKNESGVAPSQKGSAPIEWNKKVPFIVAALAALVGFFIWLKRSK